MRTGANTLTTAADYPDELTIAADDTVYVDLGPVFEAWEADIGRTYAVGADPEKHKLAADLPRVFERVQSHYRATPEITGAELYAFAQRAADEAGWVFGGAIAGHWVGEFPHGRWPGERPLKAIWPHNTAPPPHARPPRPRAQLDPGNPPGRPGPDLRRLLRAAAVAPPAHPGERRDSGGKSLQGSAARSVPAAEPRRI
ncbi:MAG: M24 family metallopeptidase [Caulobacteraceae bacterium]